MLEIIFALYGVYQICGESREAKPRQNGFLRVALFFTPGRPQRFVMAYRITGNTLNYGAKQR